MQRNIAFRLAACQLCTVLACLVIGNGHAALDAPHDTSTGTGCVSCHQMASTHSKLLPPLNHTPLPGDIDDTTSNGLCWSCHNETIAPNVKTHSSLTTSTKYGNWTVECWVCHGQHTQDQDNFNGSTYGKFIRRSINLAHIKGADGNTLADKTGTRAVKFIGNTGLNSFADGDPATIDGICEVCHTDTTAWHNDGTLAGETAHTGLKGSNCTRCHPHTEGFRAVYECLDCHENSINNRAAVGQQFSGNSHHVQTGTAVTSDKCHQCHWEADAAGKLTGHHSAMPGAAVDLVIYGAGARPETYAAGTTALAYTADGSRAQILSLNNHCLSCHSDQNNSAQPFADGKTPKQYAWDSNSVAARYAQTGTTPWGKYSSTTYPNVTPKDTRTKAFSAHGNALNNEGGWDLNETWPNTRNGAVKVACFDCHNSHGSAIEGTTTTYASATPNGGILKDTAAGKGGYAVTYKPAAGGTVATKNLRNPGASLCFDCHLTANGSTGALPWGYQSTFGASQAVIGYYDSAYLTPGQSGSQQRYPYKGLIANAGGHFGASSTLNSTPMHAINGLCTPCHDPHGVSPTLGANQQYSVPLLKGTWVTAPYKEDVAPATNGAVTYPYGRTGYRIDQNTFGTDIASTVTGVTQSDAQFAGLCLNCHPKSSLTNGVNGGTWKSVDRIHESVKGWGANVQHKYTCSKCHAPHNGSALPRLMITNCLNSSHKGQVGYNPSPVLSGTNADNHYDVGPGTGSGSGRIPGNYSGTWWGSHLTTCHENKTGSGTDQSWNEITPWAPAPAITSGPTAGSITAIGSDVRATVTWTTDTPGSSYVDYGLTSGYGTTAGNGSLALNHSVLLTGLANHNTYHYRVRSGNSSGEAVSGDSTFAISLSPTVPVVIDEPNTTCSGTCSVTLQWNASTDPDNGPIQYYVEIDNVSDFSSPDYTSDWLAGTSWTTTIGNNSIWYFRVQARDANHVEAVSAWSGADSFEINTPGAPFAPTLSWPANGYWDQVGYPAGVYPLQWNASAGATEYFCEYWGGASGNSGWTTATSFDPGDLTDNNYYYWRVKARNANGESSWSETRWWYDYWDDGGSCPMLYTWDGTNYTFESDMFGTGKLGLPKSPSGFIKPNPHDYYLLVNEPAQQEGYFEIRMVEERPETNYLDKLNLYTIDLPADKDVYAEIPKVGGDFVTAGQILHTVEKDLKHPLSVTHVNTGEEVAAKLAADDGDRLLLNEDRELYEYQTLELDLGNLSGAPMVKLIINAVSAFPDTPEGQLRMKLFSAHTKLEVLDADGNWVLVPLTTNALAKPKEIRRIHAVDITGAFLTSTYKVRLTYLFQTYIDSIYFDTSADEPITINEVPLAAADLQYYGFSRRIETPGLIDFFYGDKIDGTKFPIMPGNYTRYGDVVPLLAATDDKFVIFGTGDEIRMQFASPPPPPEGTTRKYLLYMAGYYKNFRTPVIDFTVEPLPFAAMSNFPYDETVEHYPDDAEHLDYLETYNIRVIN